jgi:hypothetical protein
MQTTKGAHFLRTLISRGCSKFVTAAWHSPDRQFRSTRPSFFKKRNRKYHAPDRNKHDNFPLQVAWRCKRAMFTPNNLHFFNNVLKFDKSLDGDNNVLYHHAKSDSKSFILRYIQNWQNLTSRVLNSSNFKPSQKWQNLTDLRGLKFCTIHHFRCQIMSFLCSPKYNVFWVEFLHIGWV